MTTRNYLTMGNRAMALSGAAMLLGIGAAYPFAHHLGLALQVIAHLSISIAAGVFKLGYVIRLAAQHELSRRHAESREPRRGREVLPPMPAARHRVHEPLPPGSR